VVVRYEFGQIHRKFRTVRIRAGGIRAGGGASDQATPTRTKAKGASSERQEFEKVIATIMGAVSEFPEALKRVVEALKTEMALCPT
jgi:hypothetical protein